MIECNSHNMYPNLSTTPSNEQEFRLNKINEIKDCFIAEIVSSVVVGSIFIASFATVIGAPVEMMSASCSRACLITRGIVKKLLKTTRNKKKNITKLLC